MLIGEGVIEAAVEHLLFVLETSVQEDFVLLFAVNSRCTFPVLVHEAYEHAKRSKTAFESLLLHLETLAYTHDISESVQRIYRTALEFTHHSKITSLAKEFYLKAYAVCAAGSDKETDSISGIVVFTW